MSQQEIKKIDHRKIILIILVVLIGMFSFGYALVPIYDLICDVTGLTGRTKGQVNASDLSLKINESRRVKVQFLATNNDGMTWRFVPKIKQMYANPGQSYQVHYYAKNHTSANMVGQAIPSVSPFQAANYFYKTECFCFNQQPLASGQAIEMPLTFIIDPDLPEGINTITLSYTLFDATNIAMNN